MMSPISTRHHVHGVDKLSFTHQVIRRSFADRKRHTNTHVLYARSGCDVISGHAQELPALLRVVKLF